MPEQDNVASREPMRGLIPAMVTPMTDADEVDTEALAALTRHLIGCGVHGLAPLGSTGEFYALSDGERTAVVETVIRAAQGRAPVIVGANAPATRDVVRYCREAQRLGAAGVLLAPPYYATPTEDELLEHFRRVGEAVAIPIMVYNCPGRTCVDMSPKFIERLTAIDAVRYVKESSGDASRVPEILRRCGDRLTVFSGCDTLVPEQFSAGAVGWVTGAANFVARQAVELVHALLRRDNDTAEALFARLRPLMTLLEDGGKYGQYVKAGCEMVGLRAGPPRLPLLPLNDADQARLREAMASVTTA